MKNDLHINLLKRNEMRYQGVVSPRFIVLSAVGVVAGLLAIFLSLYAMRMMLLKQDLKERELRWMEIRRDYEAIQKKQAELNDTRDLVQQFEKWSAGGFHWYRFLHKFQAGVPETVRLLSMTLYIKEAKTNLYEMRIAGRAQGERAEAVVINWRSAMLADPDLSQVFDTLELLSMRRDAQRAEATEVRSFELRAEGVPGKNEEAADGR
jgi:hypothetical protein